jgi:hypothetical protein
MEKTTPILPPISLPQASAGTVSIARCKDYAGNAYIARAMVIGNNTWVEIVKLNTQGQVVAHKELEMQNGPSAREGMRPRKISDMTLMLDVDDIVCTVVGCDMTDTTRLHYPEEYRWEAIATPFPPGVGEMSGRGPQMFSEGIVEVEGVSEEDKADIANRAIDGLKLYLQSETFRQLLEDKAKDALGEAADPSKYGTDTRARYFQDGFARWIKDRFWETLSAWFGPRG